MAGEISRLLFAPVSSASRSLTPTRNDATSTKTSNEEREKKRGGKKRKNKKKEKKYTSVEKRARETDSAASSVITINCSPRDNYRYPWNGRRGDMPRVRVSLRCSPTVRFFRPSPPSLPPSLAQMASAEYTIEHDTRRLLLSLSLYLGSSVSLNEFIN